MEIILTPLLSQFKIDPAIVRKCKDPLKTGAAPMRVHRQIAGENDYQFTDATETEETEASSYFYQNLGEAEYQNNNNKVFNF